MKVRIAKTCLPNDWTGLPHGNDALAVAYLKFTPRSRLRAVLLIFPHRRAMLRFWRVALDRYPGRQTVALVTELAAHSQKFDEKGLVAEKLVVDPRFVCVIGLAATHLSLEILCHESMHAGFCYARRIKGRSQDVKPDHLPEESVCYPAGRIAAQIHRVLHKTDLYRRSRLLSRNAKS